MIESTGLEAVFRGSSQALGCKSLPGCVTLCDLGLFLAVDAFLPSQTTPAPTVDHVQLGDHLLLWVAELP